jgi:nucleoside-triphosphatase
MNDVDTPQGVKVVLTGPPGAGKTTLLRRVVELLELKMSSEVGSISPSNTAISSLSDAPTQRGIDLRTRGVYCEERRVDGKRVSFDAILSSGERRSFMAKSLETGPLFPQRVGNYTVDVGTIENFVVPELLDCMEASPRLLYIDEIGKAQAYSDRYLHTASRLLRSDGDLIATVVKEDLDWSLEYKYSPFVWLIEITEKNRDHLVGVILAMFLNSSKFQNLSAARQAIVKSIFYSLLEKNQFIAARKLFENALMYVIEGRVRAATLDSEGALGSDSHCFLIEGTTGCHVLRRNQENKDFTCDCDLSRGTGKFTPHGPQMCSHEMSVAILEAP